MHPGEACIGSQRWPILWIRRNSDQIDRARINLSDRFRDCFYGSGIDFYWSNHLCENDRCHTRCLRLLNLMKLAQSIWSDRVQLESTLVVGNNGYNQKHTWEGDIAIVWQSVMTRNLKSRISNGKWSFRVKRTEFLINRTALHTDPLQFVHHGNVPGILAKRFSQLPSGKKVFAKGFWTKPFLYFDPNPCHSGARFHNGESTVKCVWLTGAERFAQKRIRSLVPCRVKLNRKSETHSIELLVLLVCNSDNFWSGEQRPTTRH